MQRRSFCLQAGAWAAALALPMEAARAATYPDRPVRVIVPYAAGGGPDVQLRQISPALGDALGQALVIDNKVGAAGVLAAQYVAQQPADGYALLMGSNTHLIQKILQPDLRFDPIADFAPVSNVASSPTVLVVAADSPYRSFDDLVKALRDKPGAYNYGSGGIGTSAHLAGATLASLEKLKVAHIPLRGSVEITASLIRGDTQFAFPVAGTGVPQVQGGKLRALAVTSRKRLAQLPDVPTLQELTRNELAVQESWFGIWAPAGTPEAVQRTVNAATRKVLAMPSIQEAFAKAGNEAVPSESPKAFADFVRSENAKWAQIVKLTGVTVGS